MFLCYVFIGSIEVSTHSDWSTSSNSNVFFSGLSFLGPMAVPTHSDWSTPQITYICRVQSSVYRLPNYWPPTPSPPSECVLPPHQSWGGGYTLAERWGGGGSIFRKTPDIGLASYSIIPLRSTSSNSSVFLLSSASVVQWQCARTPVSQRFLDLRRRQQGGCVQGSFKIEQKHHFTIVDCNLNFKLMSVSCPLPR